MNNTTKSAYSDFISDSSDVECIDDPPPVPQQTSACKNDFYSNNSDDEDLASANSLFARIMGNKTAPMFTLTSHGSKEQTVDRCHDSSSTYKKVSVASSHHRNNSAASSDESPNIEESQPCIKRPKSTKSKMDPSEKEAEKRRKQEEREQKKLEKQQEATRKRLLQEVKKKSSLKECLKLMTVIVDTGLMHYSLGAALVSSLRESDMNLDVAPQPVANLVTFTRQVMEVKDLPGGMVKAESREVMENNVLLYMPAEQFVSMSLVQLGRLDCITGPSLTEHINQIHGFLGKINLTVMVQGMEEYYKLCKIQKAKKKTTNMNFIESSQVHQVLVEVLLQTGCNVNFVDKDAEVLESIMQYAKAVAEMPYKQDRLDTGLDFHLDPGSSVQIDKEVGGLARVWRQQLMTLNNVSTEVANAIAAVYPSPGHLMKAYEDCSQEEGRKLLQDIVVRRGYGALESCRRVGKELSAKVYQLFTSTNPDDLVVNN